MNGANGILFYRIVLSSKERTKGKVKVRHDLGGKLPAASEPYRRLMPPGGLRKLHLAASKIVPPIPVISYLAYADVVSAIGLSPVVVFAATSAAVYAFFSMEAAACSATWHAANRQTSKITRRLMLE